MAWFDFLNAGAVVVALGLSAFQTRRLVIDARKRDADRRTERALELYRDLVVEGDTAKAFESVSVTLRKEGAKKFGGTTWLVMDDGEFGSGGLLDPSVPGVDITYQDFYRVLWFWERVESALHFRLIEPEVLYRTIGFHCWWWGQLLREVHLPKAVDALHKLAPRAELWAKGCEQYDHWVERCATDFDGGPPTEL
jgi:hypothetical protein